MSHSDDRPGRARAGTLSGAIGSVIAQGERHELSSVVTSLERDEMAQGSPERLAARLEQLHQTTLLINVAPTIDALISYAATGAARIFGVPAAVLLARGGNGWVAQSAPHALEPS
ncbi:MAG TPA: hypothetical protein VG368_07625, partial [Acidimicrobiales bacterium]|nr:hypothetical protein [Acidimicrobiales bacterium]